MALRTGEQYLASLRDNRTVYYAGDLVKDVTAHPELGLHARETAKQYGQGDKEDAATLDERTTKLADGTRVPGAIDAAQVETLLNSVKP